MGWQFSTPRRGALTESQLMNASTVLATDKFIELGRYTIPIGIAVAPGFGNVPGQDGAIGRIYVDIQTATVPSDGLLRLDVHNPNDRVEESVWEGRTESVRTSATDRRQQLPFPVRVPADILTENYSLVLKMKGDAADTVTQAASEILMDTTNFDAQRA